MKYIIDRFEGDYAILEGPDRETKQVRKTDLDQEAREGSLVREEDGHYILDKDGTEERRKKIQDKFDSLF